MLVPRHFVKPIFGIPSYLNDWVQMFLPLWVINSKKWIRMLFLMHIQLWKTCHVLSLYLFLGQHDVRKFTKPRLKSGENQYSC